MCLCNLNTVKACDVLLVLYKMTNFSLTLGQNYFFNFLNIEHYINRSLFNLLLFYINTNIDISNSLKPTLFVPVVLIMYDFVECFTQLVNKV